MSLLLDSSDPNHIDNFIDRHGGHVYARFFFMLKRLPAALQADFECFISKYKLFCTHGARRYRVTGASRLGDIWLHSNFDEDTKYEKRVNLSECQDWSDKP